MAPWMDTDSRAASANAAAIRQATRSLTSIPVRPNSITRDAEARRGGDPQVADFARDSSGRSVRSPVGPRAVVFQRPDAARRLQPDPGRFAWFSLPHPASGPTTIAIAPDGTLWFTEAAGNRIGRLAPDGGSLQEFDLPHAGSSPRIITIGADGRFWFSEHLGNRIGRIAADGTIAEFD